MAERRNTEQGKGTNDMSCEIHGDEEYAPHCPDCIAEAKEEVLEEARAGQEAAATWYAVIECLRSDMDIAHPKSPMGKLAGEAAKALPWLQARTAQAARHGRADLLFAISGEFDDE